MRRTILAAALLAAAAGLAGAGSAAAVCEPKYEPLCLNDCPGLPDPKDPLEYLGRVCPD